MKIIDIIDMTSMKNIYWYFENDPDIKGICIVDENIELEQVVNAAYEGDVGLFKQWQDEKKILWQFPVTMAVAKAVAKANPNKPFTHATDRPVPEMNAVRCARLEPYYFVKDEKKVYR